MLVTTLPFTGMIGCDKYGMASKNSSSDTVAEFPKEGKEMVASKPLKKLTIPKQMRAIVLSGIPWAETEFIKKDDRVDVLYTFRIPNEMRMVTVTLLQNVLVLEVLRPEHDEKTGAIVLALSPKDAQYLALALNMGSIKLLQRGEGDLTLYTMQIADMQNLFGQK